MHAYTDADVHTQTCSRTHTHTHAYTKKREWGKNVAVTGGVGGGVLDPLPE